MDLAIANPLTSAISQSDPVGRCRACEARHCTTTDLAGLASSAPPYLTRSAPSLLDAASKLLDLLETCLFLPGGDPLELQGLLKLRRRLGLLALLG